MNTRTIANPRSLASLALLLASAAIACGDEPNTRNTPNTPDTSIQTAAESLATIHLKNGSYCAGGLIDTPNGESLRWQGADFTSPFMFSLDAVNTIHFPVPKVLPQPDGEFCFELGGGDVLFGSLVSLDGEQMVIDAAELGRLHLDRPIVRRIFRWAKGDMVYFGPTGLVGWQAANTGPAAFREEAGQLVADQKGAAITRDFDAPPQASFEIELSWTGRPDFDLALGAGPDPTSALRAFHLEVWENSLIVRRETEREADVASLHEIKPGPGRAHFTVFLDQLRGRTIVFSPAGEKIADLTVATGKPQPHGGIQLVNKSGDVRLERLRISRWNGQVPRPAEGDKSRIHGPDGDVVYGELKSYDAQRAELVFAADSGEKRIKTSQASDIFLSAPEQTASGGVRLSYLRGLRVSGELVKIDDKGVWLNRPGIREPIVTPQGALVAMTVLENLVRTPELSGRSGRLELKTARLSGCLVDGEEGDQSCLVWQPVFSSTASPLARGVPARIIYRDPPPPTPVVPSNRLIANPALRRPLSILEIENKARATARRALGSQSILHLRSGDTLACTVTGIDEKGVAFKSTVSDSTFVPHAEIKVLELMPEAAPVNIDKLKKERLLTLPRMQRDNPPTQLIRAANGDYLRGRLISMDGKELRVEVRLETQTVPRPSVTRIIWLHPEELDPVAKPLGDPPQATRVQALPADGNRLTFLAHKLAGAILSGKSDLLGNCRVDLSATDQLLVGAAIEESASTLAFHQWKLTPALEPLPAPDGESGDSEGLDSALVGKPAPAIDLELLEGGRFQLSSERGNIVVLDFWASWCGPCLQTMPQIEAVTKELAGAGVKLVSVNQQEMPDRIRDVLKRLQLKSAVALDREGLIGERYGAITIPLTVIIDREGNVARAFAGGGATFGERLRTALGQVIDGPQKSE